MNDWHGAVVRLWRSETSRTDNDFLGTAFFVTPDTLLTCGHVISGQPDVFLGGDPTGIFKVKEIVSADRVDVALLRLQIPYGNRCVCVPISNTNFQVGDKVAFAGYPTHNASIDTRETQICAGNGGVGVYALQGSIGKGFSGGPVIKSGKMGGIVNAHDPTNNSAYMIPIGSFQSFLEEKVPKTSNQKATAERNVGRQSSIAFEALQAKAVDELAGELDADPHLHWAFSIAWAQVHPEIKKPSLVKANELADAFLTKLSIRDACYLADVADIWLVDPSNSVGYNDRRLTELKSKEPTTDPLACARSLEKLTLDSLAQKVYRADLAQNAHAENHTVEFKTSEKVQLELYSAVLDIRDISFLPLEHENRSPLSVFQAPEIPPGGIDLEGDLHAETAANHLLALLLPDAGKFEPGMSSTAKDVLWRRLRGILKETKDRPDKDKRGRYFLVFSNKKALQKCSQPMRVLKDNLGWLRFFVLSDESPDEEEEFGFLRHILHRHQHALGRNSRSSSLRKSKPAASRTKKRKE